MVERRRNQQQNPESPQREELIVVQGKETDKLIMMDYPVLRNGYMLEELLADPDMTPGFQRVFPFVGAVLEGEYSTKLGVGVTLPDAEESWFWGLNMPHNLIQSWRAMKLLEESEVVYSSLLSKAYTAMDKDEWDSYDALKSFDSLMGPERFRPLRRNLMNQAPSAEELQSMLERVEGTDVRPRGFELRDEVEAGRIVRTLLINKHIQRAEFRRKPL